MAGISRQEIDDLRNHADIVDVISHYIPVHRKGKSYVATCPFHNDHDPSLSISPEKQIYKCFVCGNGGNVFSFVKNYEKISFPEAVERVAEITGYHLSEKPAVSVKPKDPHKERLHSVLAETIRYTMYQLHTASGKQAEDYLKNRGLDEDTCNTFQIGWNPDGDTLSRFLKAKGFSDADLVGANVTRMGEYGSRDVFANRITFPIHDANGNPIGFSARTMDPDNASKYINTNDTDVFHKGDIVYNYHRAKATARQNGRMYICEGVTDVIAFYRAGIANAVCTLGTSCTEAQIRALKNSAARIVFCYDGDHAGQAATMRAGKMALNAGCDIAIVLNKTGHDPDEIIREGGAQALQDMVSHEISWMEFVLQYLAGETNMDSYLEKKEMADKAMQEINALPDEADRQYFTDQLSEMTGFHLNYRHEQLPVFTAKNQQVQKLVVPDGTKEAEMQILAMMMKSPQAIQYFEKNLGYLTTPECQTLAMMMIDMLHTKGKTDPSSLMDMTQETSVQNLIAEVADSPVYSMEYDEKMMAGAVRKVEMSVLSEEIKSYKEQLSMQTNEASSRLLLKQYSECLLKLRRLVDDDNREKQ